MPNLLPDWAPWIHPAGRLIWFSLAFLVGLGIIVALLRRPKSDEPVTWAQAMGGAVGVLVMMTLAYGVLPHEWITFADTYLRWDTTSFFLQTYAVDVTHEAVRDIIAVGLYIVFLGLNIVLFVKWQERPTRAEATAASEPVDDEAPVTGTSRFGRPVRSKAKV